MASIPVRCMGVEKQRLFCEQCRRLPKSPREEVGDEWVKPSKAGRICAHFLPSK